METSEDNSVYTELGIPKTWNLIRCIMQNENNFLKKDDDDVKAPKEIL